MKKFLFTLAALLMAGSICAEEYLYIEDFEVKAAEVGTNITVPVKAHFDYAVNAATVNLTLPDGLVLRKIDKGSSISGLTYFDDFGDEWTADNTIFTPSVPNTNFAFATVDAGYYEVDGQWVYYGAVKFMPGEYEEMAILTIRVTADFQGGDIIVKTEPACGADERPDVEPCPKNQVNEKTAVVTLEGAEPPVEVTEKPVITSENDDEAQQTTVTATGNGHICLYQDDILVAEGEGSASFVIAYGEMEEEYGFSATAQEEGKEVSEYALATIYVPAAEVVPPTPEDLTGEIVFGELNEETGEIAVTYNGPEEVTLTATYAEVTRGGETTVTLPDYGTYEITAVASAEGFNDKEAKKTVTWEEPVTPPAEQTEAPVITVVDDPEAETVTVTATGNGHICLYWDDQLMAEGEGTAEWVIPYGDDPEGEEYGVSATAQEEGKEVSEYALETVYVPGKEVTPPEDPHAQGYWLVLLDKDGNEVYNELTPGQGIQVALDYGTFGGFNAEEDPNNPMVPYYILVDGVRYGAETEDAETHMGPMEQTLQNPLVEGENNYVVPTGFNYLMGVYVDNDGNMFVMCAQAGYVGVDELLNGKTVAGVRYFNMAGQEMQEANGVTIIVTTYTDGTTSAVKVMK